MLTSLATWALCLSSAIGAPTYETGSFDREERQDLSSSNLSVDLGYAVYKGAYNSTVDLNIWKGYVELPAFLVSIFLCSHYLNSDR
jgi:hypothetical protein